MGCKGWLATGYGYVEAGLSQDFDGKCGEGLAV
jgi:hypothetical protein